MQRVDITLSDEELTALALAADPCVELSADAVPIVTPGVTGDDLLLPSWYMPAPSAAHVRRGWRRRVAILLIVAFVLIDAAGLCSTYGPVTFG